MAEFLLHFLRPFTIINTIVQGTFKASLQETWVKYEKMFDCLQTTRTALEGLEYAPSWFQDIQEAIEAMWKKLSKYYAKTDHPFAFVDATLLHPALKLQFMKKSGYGDDKIKQYENQAHMRFARLYGSEHQLDSDKSIKLPQKRRHSDTDSDSSSSNENINELTTFLQAKRDKTVSDPLKWWAEPISRVMYPNVSLMARDTYSAPVSSAGVEREFSISGRIITKQRNRLSPKTIRDLMQVKRWNARHSEVAKSGLISSLVEDNIDIDGEICEDESENIVNKELVDWLKEWEKKNSIRGRINKMARWK